MAGVRKGIEMGRCSASPADRFISHMDGPGAIVRACRLCTFSDVVRKLPRGLAGRGWGMREGNKQRGRLIQHIRAEHAAEYEEAKAGRWPRKG